jgi:S-DNA-T family DNA segregation ATPase FtsK/SpoIIIE
MVPGATATSTGLVDLLAGGPAAPLVVAAAEPAEAALAFRGLLAALRRSRTGLLLSPRSAADGEAFGLRVGAIDAVPPGRGLLVHAGRAIAVQVADPVGLLGPDREGADGGGAAG